MRIRLHSTPGEVKHLIAQLGQVVEIVAVSRTHHDRAPSQLVRVYLMARLQTVDDVSASSC